MGTARSTFETRWRHGKIIVNDKGIFCQSSYLLFWRKVHWQVRREDVMSIVAGSGSLFGAACELIVHTRFGQFKAKMVPARHVGAIRDALGLSF